MPTTANASYHKRQVWGPRAPHTSFPPIADINNFFKATGSYLPLPMRENITLIPAHCPWWICCSPPRLRKGEKEGQILKHSF